MNRTDTVNKLRKDNKKLRREARFLNTLLGDSHEEEWDRDGIYKDVQLNKNEFDQEVEYPKGYAEWLKNRWGIKE